MAGGGGTWPSRRGEVFWGTRERLPDHSCPTLLCPSQATGLPSSQSSPCDFDPSTLSPASRVSIPMLAPLPPENDTIYWVDMGLSTIQPGLSGTRRGVRMW